MHGLRDPDYLKTSGIGIGMGTVWGNSVMVGPKVGKGIGFRMLFNFIACYSRYFFSLYILFHNFLSLLLKMFLPHCSFFFLVGCSIPTDLNGCREQRNRRCSGFIRCLAFFWTLS